MALATFSAASRSSGWPVTKPNIEGGAVQLLIASVNRTR
jgi:hypothetical protein